MDKLSTILHQFMPESGNKKGPGEITREDMDAIKAAFRDNTTMHVDNLTDEEVKELYRKLDEQNRVQ